MGEMMNAECVVIDAGAEEGCSPGQRILIRHGELEDRPLQFTAYVPADDVPTTSWRPAIGSTTRGRCRCTREPAGRNARWRSVRRPHRSIGRLLDRPRVPMVVPVDGQPLPVGGRVGPGDENTLETVPFQSPPVAGSVVPLSPMPLATVRTPSEISPVTFSTTTSGNRSVAVPTPQ